MGSNLTLTRQDFKDGLAQVDKSFIDNKPYLERFEINFPEGLNTASALEICRIIQEPTMENKIRLMRICVTGRNVSVKCPNGETESFKISNVDDSIEGFDLFRKEPLALIAITGATYGHILKKSLRLSTARPGATAKAE